MRKQSYVRLDQIWDIPASELRLFDPSSTLPCETRITEESYNDFMYELHEVAKNIDFGDCEVFQSKVHESQAPSTSRAEPRKEREAEMEGVAKGNRSESKLAKFIAAMNVY